MFNCVAAAFRCNCRNAIQAYNRWWCFPAGNSVSAADFHPWTCGTTWLISFQWGGSWTWLWHEWFCSCLEKLCLLLLPCWWLPLEASHYFTHICSYSPIQKMAPAVCRPSLVFVHISRKLWMLQMFSTYSEEWNSLLRGELIAGIRSLFLFNLFFTAWIFP